MAEKSYEQMRAERMEEIRKRREQTQRVLEQLKTVTTDLPNSFSAKPSDDSSIESKAQIELDHRIKEATQGQLFRNLAFWGALGLWVIVFGVWLYLFCSWPEPTKYCNPPVQLYYLWGMKTSLATVLLIAVTLGVMRFALRCYGYHHLQEGKKDSSDSDDKSIYESIKQLLKDQPSE